MDQFGLIWDFWNMLNDWFYIKGIANITQRLELNLSNQSGKQLVTLALEQRESGLYEGILSFLRKPRSSFFWDKQVVQS